MFTGLLPTAAGGGERGSSALQLDGTGVPGSEVLGAGDPAEFFVAGVAAEDRPTRSPAHGYGPATLGLSRPVSSVLGSQPNVVRVP